MKRLKHFALMFLLLMFGMQSIISSNVYAAVTPSSENISNGLVLEPERIIMSFSSMDLPDMNVPQKLELYIKGERILESSNWGMASPHMVNYSLDFSCGDLPKPDILIGEYNNAYGYNANDVTIKNYFADGTVIDYTDQYDHPFYKTNDITQGYIMNESEYKEICGIDLGNNNMKNLTDISGNTFESYIMNLYNDGIISGYADNTFKPDNLVSRGAIAKFIKNAFEFETDTSCGNFPDVDLNNTFYEHITTLKCKNIIGGYSNGNYAPDDTVTRGQAMKFIINASRIKHDDDNYLPNTYSENIFPDVLENNPFYDYIMSGYSHQIVSGKSDGTFGPGGDVTRGAISKMIDNARKK